MKRRKSKTYKKHINLIKAAVINTLHRSNKLALIAIEKYNELVRQNRLEIDMLKAEQELGEQN